jgi:hypothetical protein
MFASVGLQTLAEGDGIENVSRAQASVKIPFASSLAADNGAVLKFSRPGEAMYFDVNTNRIITVPANTPRFVAGEKKSWGSSGGIFLECETENLLSDSSFEGDLAAWSFTGKVEKRKGAGIHGENGLAITGSTTITHKGLALKTAPAFSDYSLSIYVRRVDGNEVADDEIQYNILLDGKEAMTKHLKFYAEKQGGGPWYRFAGLIRVPGGAEGALFPVVLKFKAGEYIVDCAQLEYLWGRSGGSSSYISGKRATEKLQGDAKTLFPGEAWSYSFWKHTSSLTASNEYFFTIRDKDLKSLVSTRWKDTVADGKKALGDKVSASGWLFLSVTYDGKKMDVYHNGISNHTLQGPFDVEVPSTNFDKVFWALGYDVPMGLTADFATWNRALAPDEVLALYRTGNTKDTKAADDKAKTGTPVTFKTKTAGNVSVNVFDAGQKLVYKLATGKKLPVGEHTLYWDGCDDTGKPAPAGDYTFKGLVSNVRSVWDGKVGNTSPSPGREELQYRNGHYSDVIAMPDGGLITTSFWGEHSRIIQYIDGAKDYPVRWASAYNSPWPAFLTAGAADERYLYTVSSCFAGKDMYREVMVRWSLKGGMRLNEQEVTLNKPHGLTGPMDWWPGYTDNPSNPAPFAGVCGLACRSGKLYIPLFVENRIAVYDAEKLKEISSFECPSPRRIALDKNGGIFVTSGSQVLRFDPDGTKRTDLVTGLDTPWGIAVSPDNKIYVTESGDTHQVKVFDTTGKLLRVFGQKGGHKGGKVSPDLLEMPLSVIVNEQGQIFITDLGGQRVLALNPDFTLRKVIHGRMPETVSTISNLDRSLVYTSFTGRRKHLWEYKVNYEDHSSELVRRWNLPRFYPDMLKMMRNGQIYFHKWNGRLFGVQAGFVFEMVGDNLLPRVAMGSGKPPTKEHTAAKKNWVWRDLNADGQIQDNEFEYGDWPMTGAYHDGYVDKAGNMFLPNEKEGKMKRQPEGMVLKVPFEGPDANGIPIYSPAKAQWLIPFTDENNKDTGIDGKPYSIDPSTYIEDKNGNYYISDCGNMFANKKEFSVRKYAPDGSLIWKAGHRLQGTIMKPGSITWIGYASGIVDDRYLFYVDYTGPINCWDTDGLWVGRLFSDLPEELKNEGECFGGVVFRHHANGKVYAYSFPDCTYRISRITVEGLDDIERFTGKTVLTDMASPRNMESAGLPPWSILHTRGPVEVDGEIGVYEWGTNTDTQRPVDFEYNGKKVARSWVQWDEVALYLAWDIEDNSPAVNNTRGNERWGADQVELMIRAEAGTITKSLSKKHSATEYQLEIGPDGDRRLDAYVINNGSDRKGKFLPGAKVALKVKEDKSGYTMEASIPWASLGDYRPKKGDKILWNMKIHWGTADGGGVAYLVQWAPGYHVNPQNWGTAVFE